MNRKFGSVAVGTVLLALSGCGGDGGGGGANSTYSVSGVVTGLNGDAFTLRNGTAKLMLSAGATRFQFPEQANDTPYDITIDAQPTFPIQLCNVSNGSGTVHGANVTNVTIACAAGYVVIGVIRGLAGSGLVIRNNDSDMPITAGMTGFTFLPQLDGQPYNVTVATQPSNPAQTCTVSNGSGVLHSHVFDVVITCEAAVAAAANVAADSQGNAIAVWEQTDGPCSNIFSNSYAPGTGWSSPMRIDANACSARAPQIAIDGDGNALAIWQQSDASGQRFWANRYRAGSGWETAAVINGNDLGDALSVDPATAAMFPQLALDSKGTAIVVWGKDRAPLFPN